MVAKRMSGTIWRGITAGVVGTAALVGTRSLLYRLESDEVRQREVAVRGENQQTPLQTPVRQVHGKLRDGDLSEEQEARWGKRLAWGLGIAGVAAYALARERLAPISRGAGIPFGLGVFLLEDELLFPLLGWAKGPKEYPWQAHARGLAAHAAYGVAAESTLRLLDRRAAGA